jgi:diguanylate cyclase (GGDEF)-like protein
MTEPTDPIACDLFEFAPISLWEEDYSAIKQRFDQWRAAGVTDLRAYLAAHPEAVGECMAAIQVLNVNRRTVELFRAGSKRELLDNLGRIFRDGMGTHFADELVDMWDGKLAYEREGINYALDGTPIDIRLHWAVLPGAEASLARVLVSIEDITARKQAERATAASEARFRGLFDNAPVSLWEEDYSALKRYLDGLRAAGVTDLREYLDEHPEAITECMAAIRVLNVNRRTLELFRAGSKEALLSNLGRVFRDDMGTHFRDELIDMWDGKLAYQREGINYALTGDPVHIELFWAVLPGSEVTWERVLVSLTDITARKKAEDYLKYLGTHDVLTGAYNRAYFEEELKRLGRSRRYPISLVLADLNGLKQVNDQRGHAEGDKLIRRAAEALQASVRADDVVARVGGDEFALILPATDAAAAEQALARIRSLVDLNNKYYGPTTLSLALGVATGVAGSNLSDVLREADDQMYVEKRQHHDSRH